MGGISITQLLIIAVIVVLLFGTKKTAHAGFRSRRLDQGLQKSDR
ncbi:twin-arginine translocation protein TatA [Serratia sp. SCBI]|nr:twin-arginine translocation protein TatA [Serratia sp. SCBI]